ncbi:hypothetical protein DV736_g5576, partial [Chaetothyriales sp. CBS 134916]
MGYTATSTIPLIPLARDAVLLPGVTLRIPVSGRADVSLILSSAFQRTRSRTVSTNIPIGCKEDLFTFGTLAKIAGVQAAPGHEAYLIVEGLQRFRIDKVVHERPYFEAEVTFYEEEAASASDGELRASFSRLKQRSRELLTLLRLSSLFRPASMALSPLVARRFELFIAKKDLLQAGELADFMTDIVEAGFEDKLGVLKTLDLHERLEMRRVHEAGLSAEAQKVADRELRRLKKMNPANAEYGVIRTYVENLVEIPWTKTTEEQLGVETLRRARKQLDDDHYGLEKVKKRLLEYLAVLKLKQSVNADVDQQIARLTKQLAPPAEADAQEKEAGDALPEADRDAATAKLHVLKSKRMVDKSPILLLVGPPGVGKTSLAKSIALSLGRKFHRISLGGVRDEAEIRGHRRTYVAAMPGLIVSGLKKAGVANPVFLLDEIDKVSTSNFHGDPSAAMLEVLDPEQNHSFNDHYVNIPIDLSKVLFIATANTLDTIPAPLLDRMETIQLPGYTTIEKRHIAKNHLIPKQIRTNGLGEGQVVLSDAVVDAIITGYTRESGVRNLEREIGSVCRYKAVQYADSRDANTPDKYQAEVRLDELEDMLGVEKFEEEIAEKKSRPGVVTGLVAYSSGGQGSILFIEVADMPGKGGVQLTGKLGDVLKESVEVALTWVKAHSFELGLSHDPAQDIMEKRSVHVHCPAGAVPKDGPSAGLAHTIALISLFSGRAVAPTIAMTGEISLRGRVLPVGGIKEKLIGAHRAGVRTVLLPAQNRKDVKDVPREVRDDLNIIYVRHVYEALAHIWPQSEWADDRFIGRIESRL